MLSTSNPPCAACKIQRRKCNRDCVFAPHFPAEDLRKFAEVHKVFGASNVGRMLINLNEAHRRDAVQSLVYEAEARLRDPVYGCTGLISVLQHQMEQLEIQLLDARKQLAAYMGRRSLVPILRPPESSGLSQISPNPNHMMGFNGLIGGGGGGGSGGYHGGDLTSGPHIPAGSLSLDSMVLIMHQKIMRVTMMTRSLS